MRLGLPDGSSEAEDSTQYRAYTMRRRRVRRRAERLAARRRRAAATPVADDEVLATQADLAETLMGQTTSSRSPRSASPTTTTTVAFQVVPADGPSSESTEQLVHDLRDLSPLEGDITLGVAGQASGNIDISEKLAGVLPLYLGVVVGLSLIILILVFRSILVPLIATGGLRAHRSSPPSARSSRSSSGAGSDRCSACTIPGPC